MRRIAIALTLLALVAGLHACAADAPTKPPSGGGGGTSALQIQLFTSNANPRAGTCTLVEAIVSLNGNPVVDGTGVSFTTDFGTFSQNGLPSVSVVTSNGTSVTALCGPGAGTAKVKATATSGGKTGSATITIAFQPDAGTLPFVSSCDPSFGATTGGTVLTLNGGRFFGDASTTRVQFTVNGVTRDGIVQEVTANAITVLTPSFAELTAATNPAAVTVTVGTNSSTPVVLSLPTCFSFGSAASSTPTIAALLPSSGTTEGNTRVTIIGSGFSTAGVQVFFGAVEATVVSVNFNQIVVLSPPVFGSGAGTTTASVTVKNINSGLVSTGVDFRYTPALVITSANNLTQSIDNLSLVTIFGRGFQAPVAVTLAGIPATIQSVSSTEIVVIPSVPLLGSCDNLSGGIAVVNINSGDSTVAEGLTFTYVVPQLVITGVSPQSDHDALGNPVTQVQITGSGFPSNPAQAEVKFGTKTAFVDLAASTPGSLIVTIPPGTVVENPPCINGNLAGTFQVVETVDITVTNRATFCSATVSQAFTYKLPCILPTATPVP
ncbi:MAG: IPT/TIG domain-containing protein [Acidobacteriota bacterium]